MKKAAHISSHFKPSLNALRSLNSPGTGHLVRLPNDGDRPETEGVDGALAGQVGDHVLLGAAGRHGHGWLVNLKSAVQVQIFGTLSLDVSRRRTLQRPSIVLA